MLDTLGTCFYPFILLFIRYLTTAARFFAILPVIQIRQFQGALFARMTLSELVGELARTYPHGLLVDRMR